VPEVPAVPVAPVDPPPLTITVTKSPEDVTEETPDPVNKNPVAPDVTCPLGPTTEIADPPDPPVIVTVVYPEESVTVETPDPAKLSPVIPVPTRAPLKNVFIAEALPVAAFGK
jgi:hypothetical protein